MQEKDLNPIEKMKESEYWIKDLPGVNGWTVGELIEMLRQEGLLKAGDTPEIIYDLFK